MLKITRSPNMSKPEVGNSKVKIVKFGIGIGGEEFAKKSRKLLKCQKLSKSRKKL